MFSGETSTNLGTDATQPGRHATRRTWGIALAAGLVAGVAAWLAGEGILRAYSSALRPAMKPVPELQDSLDLLKARVDSGAAAVAATGGLIGFALGLAGGVARRSAKSAFGTGLLGLIVGGLGGWGMARLVVPGVYANLDPQSSDLVVPLMAHIAVWSVAGLAGGLAYGLGASGKGLWPRTVVGGVVGAALATVAYEVAGAILLPTHRTHLPVAGSPEARALAQILVGLGTAAGVIAAADEAKKKPARA
ncbi:hypothetical protein EP7_000450 [Isosphaeraceae bacterium EP7]